jgi:DNA polymerase III alpha subunit
MYKTFEKREHFEYGIKALDDLIQTPEMPHSFILYQEMSMAVLNFAGIPMSECYEIIKNIAKKRVEKVLKYKAQFIEGFTKTLIEQEKQDEETAQKVSHDVWKILEDSSSYSFNASHSYCVAIDSLYGAFLKTNYPLQFYEVLLNILQDKGEKDRLNLAKNEAESYFKIKFPPYRFGQDNRSIVADFENNSINNSIAAIKGFGSAVGDTLYECGKQGFTRFTDVLKWLNDHSVKSSTVEPLIKIDYFQQFGNCVELLQINEMFNFFKCGEAKNISKEKVVDSLYLPFIQKNSSGTNASGKELKSYVVGDIVGLIRDCEGYILSLGLKDLSYRQKAAIHLDLLGYVDLTTGRAEDRTKLLITDIAQLKNQTGDVWGHALFVKSIGTGNTARLTLYDRLYVNEPLFKGDIVDAYVEPKYDKQNRKWWYLTSYEKI